MGIQPDTPHPRLDAPRPAGLFYGWRLVVMLGITQTITWGILYYGFTVYLPGPGEADRGWTRGQRLIGAFSLAMLLSASAPRRSAAGSTTAAPIS